MYGLPLLLVVEHQHRHRQTLARAWWRQYLARAHHSEQPTAPTIDLRIRFAADQAADDLVLGS